jgi:hypothetical protein
MVITQQNNCVEVIEKRPECSFMIFRARLHFICMFKNPSQWRFYAKGILRELGINL